MKNKNMYEYLKKLGIFYEGEGILGGTGSGGDGGYYNRVTDSITGANGARNKFNKEEFDKWIDNFNLQSFASNTILLEDLLEYSELDTIQDLFKKHDEGYYPIISNFNDNIIDEGSMYINPREKSITLYAYPFFTTDEDEWLYKRSFVYEKIGDVKSFTPIFIIDENDHVVLNIPKQELKGYLELNIKYPRICSIF